MRNFKRILAIVLVVMMVVPMMTTGLSAATAETTYVVSNTGTEVAGGNWKAFVTCDFSGAYGADFAVYNLNGIVTVDSEGQMCLYNTIQKDFAGTPFVTPAARNVLQSTNTTAIDNLFMQMGFIASGNNGAYPVNLSYAFSETQLQGALTADSYTVENGFAVEDNGMVKDGLVINMYRTSVAVGQDPSYEFITAYVMENGKVVSSQTFEIDNQGKDFGLSVGHPHRTFFTFDDAGVLTFHVEDNYSANGAYINQTYTFDELDMSTINATEKMYYLSVGSGDYWNAPSSAGVNLNLSRIGTVIENEDGTYDVDGETKNYADWTGFGVASCEHVWGEYVEVSAPTCTEAGLYEAACQNGCGATDVKTVAANGHAWGDWTVTVEPDCVNPGSKDRACGVCGTTESQAVAANGHAWGDWYTTVEADCVNDGMEQRDCAACGSYEEQIVAAYGHTWVWDVIPDYTTNGTRHCDACGTVEADLAYDVEYYWTFASNNNAGAIDESYAEYNNEYVANVDGIIELQDMSLAYGGDYNYNTMLKATSNFATEISGFWATVENVTEGYEGTALEGQYPTVLSFLWTTEKENYDGANEFSTYNIALSGTAESSRYGHLWDNYVAGKEYSVNVVLSDACLFWGNTWYGELDDGEYDWIYYAVINNGNFWNLKMVQPSPAISAFEPITVSIFQEMDFASNKLGLFCDVNGFLFDFGDLAGSQTADKNYYFSVAAYGDGMNAATASFKLTDVCGQEPALFNGYEHECYDLDPDTVEIPASCFTDGAHICAVCQAVIETVPAIGQHSWKDATCTDPKTCSVCGETEGEAAGHDYVDFVCDVCGDLEGGAYIENEDGKVVYADLHEALKAAVSGDKIVLLEKQEKGPYTVGVQQNIGIDLNGKNIRNKSGDALIVDQANVLIYGTDGGTIRSSDGVSIVVKNSGNVNVMDAITVRCSSEEGFDVFSIDETSAAVIYALGGRYYKNPVAAGAELAPGLAIQENSSSNYTVIEAPETCAHEWGDWVVTVEPQVGVAGEETRTCALCGETETQEVPALEAPVEKAYTITFDPDGGVMPEGALLVLPIDYNENYKEAAGYDYPVPTLEGGYVFAGWYWEEYNYTLYKGDWDNGYYAITWSISVVALYEECPHANWGEWVEVSAPTYDAEGVEERTCADCGMVETKTTDKLERPWVITFDADGGVMPEGVPTEMRIATNENYKEATGYDYPVPTLEGYVFAGWYWELYNYVLDEGTWNGGYFAVAMDVPLVALYEECAHVWGDWVVTVEPQVGVAGEQTRTCTACGLVETEEVAPLEPTYDYKITFDADGGVMPEGVANEYGINYMDNYKEATGIDYPVPTLEGYVFAGWYWELYNYVLDEGTWNGGYFAVQMDVDLVALYEEAPAPAEVEVAVADNTITVSNVDSAVKDIFVAAGKQETYKDVKANMLYHLYATSHKVVDGAWSYDVSENGIYTVLVRYNDGTVEAKYFVVECNDGIVADFVQDGATVTLNNLDDLYVLRYVAGEYDSSYAIKRAEGVVNVSPKYDADKFVDGSFTVTLEPGTYSFVTQFNDGNYVYYTVVVEAPVVEKDYTITFDPDGGVMPEGALTVLPINYNENYKEAAGYDYPEPTLEGYTFAGWYWEEYNYTLTKGDWDTGYFAITWSIDVVALYNEA